MVQRKYTEGNAMKSAICSDHGRPSSNQTKKDGRMNRKGEISKGKEGCSFVMIGKPRGMLGGEGHQLGRNGDIERELYYGNFKLHPATSRKKGSNCWGKINSSHKLWKGVIFF